MALPKASLQKISAEGIIIGVVDDVVVLIISIISDDADDVVGDVVVVVMDNPNTTPNNPNTTLNKGVVVTGGTIAGSNIYVTNVASADVANINGIVTLITSSLTSAVSFTGVASVFRSVAVQSFAGALYANPSPSPDANPSPNPDANTSPNATLTSPWPTRNADPNRVHVTM